MVSSLESAPERLWTELFDLDKPEVPLLAPTMMLNTAQREDCWHLQILTTWRSPLTMFDVKKRGQNISYK